MKNNLKQNVIEAIAKTQDGNVLREGDHWSKFILDRINENSSAGDMPHVDISTLISDFKYMRDQLSRAIVPLEEYADKWA